jgi:hypothetical protein
MSTPSPNDTTIIPGYGFISDGSGDIFSITPQGSVYVSNAAGYQPLGYTANVIEAAYVNGQLWQENASQLWWEYTGNPSAPVDGFRHKSQSASSRHRHITRFYQR